MSQFELIYLIILRSDSIINALIFFSSIQIAVFVGAYFIREMPDMILRHAIAVFYWIVTLLCAGKNNMDFYFVFAYTEKLVLLYSKNPDIANYDYLADFNSILNRPLLVAFTLGLNLLYGLLAFATMYFLYFHKFKKN